MEQLIESFGLDARLIVFQIINFGIVLTALWYFLYTPVLKLLREREDKIKQGLADATAAAAAKAGAESEKRDILAAAHQEAEGIDARARTSAGEQSAAIVAAAEAKAEQVIKNAEALGRDLKTKAERDSEAEISKLAILAAEKILRERAS